MMTKLTGESWGPVEAGPPRQLVVLCHGMGGNAGAVLNHARLFSQYLPQAVFAAPNGPQLAGNGRSWFNIGNLDPAVLVPALRNVAAQLDMFIDDALAAHGLDRSEYALVGFSQGAMTALFTGPRRAAGPKAILSFSGAMFGSETLPAEIRNRAPVFLGHGERDQVVPSFASIDAAATLRELGVTVKTMYDPDLGHDANEPLMRAGAAFMQAGFLPAGS